MLPHCKLLYHRTVSYQARCTTNSNALRCSALRSFCTDLFFERYRSIAACCSRYPSTTASCYLVISPHSQGRTCAVDGFILNDWFIPITTSYRVVVVGERGGFIHSSDNPSTSFSKRYSRYWGISWWSHRKPNVSNIYSSSILVTGKE